jgi:hypothetical protein
VIDDPAEALDILLEELKRQKAAGLRRVSVSDEAVATLKALAGAPVAAPAPAAAAKPAAITAPAASRPSTPLPFAPKPAVVATTPVIADAPIFTLPAGTKAERMQALRQQDGAHALKAHGGVNDHHLHAQQRKIKAAVGEACPKGEAGAPGGGLSDYPSI